MRRPRIFLLVALAALAGCDKKSRPEGTTVHREGNPPVISVGSEDAEMNATIEKARQTVGEFISHLQNPKPTETDFGVKAEFADGDRIEHMWLDDVTFDGEKFHGTVGNEPLRLQNVKLGDPRTVAPGEISDWMILDGNRLVGGYSIRVLYKRMPPEERAGFKFIID